MAGKAVKQARIILSSVLAGLLFYSSGCTMYMAAAFQNSKASGGVQEEEGSLATDPQGVSTSAGEVTLAWDPPPSAVASYRVLFRIHDTTDWYSLTDELPAEPVPQLTVQHGDVGSGIFDFGVIAVNAESAESALHMSLETTAQPDTGWYLVWED